MGHLGQSGICTPHSCSLKVPIIKKGGGGNFVDSQSKTNWSQRDFSLQQGKVFLRKECKRMHSSFGSHKLQKTRKRNLKETCIL